MLRSASTLPGAARSQPSAARDVVSIGAKSAPSDVGLVSRQPFPPPASPILGPGAPASPAGGPDEAGPASPPETA